MVKVIENGELIYELPSLDEIRRHCAEEMDTLWDEVKRFSNPHHYYVDLSQRLWDIRNELLNQARH
jgi:nicotinate phosphoribosyltransferase